MRNNNLDREVDEYVERVSERARRGIRRIGINKFSERTGLYPMIIEKVLEPSDDEKAGGLHGLDLGRVERIRKGLSISAKDFYQ